MSTVVEELIESQKSAKGKVKTGSKVGKALEHRMSTGDATMIVKKEKSFTLNFVVAEDRSDAIITKLARREIQTVLAKHGAVSDNLDEVLSKSITGVMCYGEKK
ncbi:hypothetical protein [Cohnella sp. AR92]|uniref:hypothetical protein n=1 Tax=Cohnella sp. AR92 TaxID=648716 RepID=UPI000F8CD0B2|nr:hypothetical protein [Cohnella sp. AR92]RUS44553.1 hypothetical protein ELR57_22485 [Cohnella sp. AR92]